MASIDTIDERQPPKSTRCATSWPTGTQRCSCSCPASTNRQLGLDVTFDAYVADHEAKICDDLAQGSA